MSEAECRAAESATFLNRVFDGALSPMLAHFGESNALSDEELVEWERLCLPSSDPRDGRRPSAHWAFPKISSTLNITSA